MPCVAEIVNRSLKADCTDFTIVLSWTALEIVELERHSCIVFDLKRNKVIPHCTRSVNCRLCLQHFNEYHAYE